MITNGIRIPIFLFSGAIALLMAIGAWTFNDWTGRIAILENTARGNAEHITKLEGQVQTLDLTRILIASSLDTRLANLDGSLSRLNDKVDRLSERIR